MPEYKLPKKDGRYGKPEPYVDFLVPRKVQNGSEFEIKHEVSRFWLDNSAGTLDFIVNWTSKDGFRLIGCGNLNAENPEHARISDFYESQKRLEETVRREVSVEESVMESKVRRAKGE